MNERILELAKQAGYTPLEPRTFADDLQEIFLQKFAKLIVQKCVQRCEKLALKHHVEGAFACAEDLRKYFGVK